MTGREWLECGDPKPLLAMAAGAASAADLRRIACRCCRRVFDRAPSWFDPLWPDGRFSVARPGWRGAPLVEAVAAAEASIVTGAAIPRALVDPIAEMIGSSRDLWQTANHRLGEGDLDGDFENLGFGWQSAAAVAACCADDIHRSVAECVACAAEAVGWTASDTRRKPVAEAAERQAQAVIVRSVLVRPTEPVTLSCCTRCGRVVLPYPPSTISREDARDYGVVPSGLDAAAHYWCGFCGEHWLAVSVMDTGRPCADCGAFMPLAAAHCGGCGTAMSARGR